MTSVYDGRVSFGCISIDRPGNYRGDLQFRVYRSDG